MDAAEAAARRIEWASRTTTQGEVLDAFAAHCRDELEDVDVLEAGPAHMLTQWRREVARLELRAAITGDVAAPELPTMLLGDVERGLDRLVEAFVADAELRTRLVIVDLARLEKLGAVRSSVFVYFEWFLRDAYGVKLLPSPAFTQGLVERGIISLGMG